MNVSKAIASSPRPFADLKLGLLQMTTSPQLDRQHFSLDPFPGCREFVSLRQLGLI